MHDRSTAARAAPTSRARTRARETRHRAPSVPPLAGDEGHLLRQLAARLERSVARLAPWAPGWLIEEGCGFAWEQLIRHQPERSAVLAWLRVVAYHEVLRLARIKRRECSLDVGLSGDDCKGSGPWASDFRAALADPHDIETAIEAREALRALAGLRWRRRRVLVLRLAGYSYKEIATRLGITYTNVNRHITEGTAELRRLWEVADSRGPFQRNSRQDRTFRGLRADRSARVQARPVRPYARNPAAS